MWVHDSSPAAPNPVFPAQLFPAEVPELRRVCPGLGHTASPKPDSTILIGPAQVMWPPQQGPGGAWAFQKRISMVCRKGEWRLGRRIQQVSKVGTFPAPRTVL